ncbi:MAG: polymer-forming cytoskeletal protein [Pyrinomonadaceae bacterium]
MTRFGVCAGSVDDRAIAALRTFFLFALFIPTLCLTVFAHPEITTSEDQTTVIVNDAPEQDIISFGKSVIVIKRAKGVLAVGGDITVEGRVEGDVATIGGNVIQKEGGYIGGEVIAIGGSYKPESATPRREANKQTVVLGVFEEELRNFGQNPTSVFAPSFSIGFLAQRLFIALVWFVISLVFTTLAPGAVSRAVARVQISTLKVFAIGAISFLAIATIIVGGSITLPNYLGAGVAFLGAIVVLLGFVFGRVVLQVSAGKLIQKHFLAGNNRSETLALLIGVLTWTLLLSLPYVWLIALFVIFAAGVGLVLTGKTSPKWQNP